MEGNKNITWAALILGILYNTIPRFIGHPELYYNGQAISFTLILIAGYYNTRDRKTQILFVATILLSINNLWDELIGTALELNLREIFFDICIGAWAGLKYIGFDFNQFIYSLMPKHGSKRTH